MSICNLCCSAWSLEQIEKGWWLLMVEGRWSFPVSVEDRGLGLHLRAGSPNPVSVIPVGWWPRKTISKLVASTLTVLVDEGLWTTKTTQELVAQAHFMIWRFILWSCDLHVTQGLVTLGQSTLPCPLCCRYAHAILLTHQIPKPRTRFQFLWN